jgi:hypothetical protein
MDSKAPESVSKILVHLFDKIENAFCPVEYEHSLCEIQCDIYGLFNANKQKIKSYIIYLVVFNVKKAKSEILTLIDLSDRIYASWLYISKNKKLDVFHGRGNYIKILESIDELVNGLLLYNKKLIETLPLTKYSLQNTKLKLKQRINFLKVAPNLKDVNYELISVLQVSMIELLRKKNILREELSYINSLLIKLSKFPEFTTESLEWLLLERGFNSNMFLEYYIKKSNQQTLDDSSLHKQIESVLKFQEQLHCLVPLETYRMYPKVPSIINQLLVFFKDKKESLNQLLDLRRSEILDSKLLESNEKVLINMPVAQFGLLIKLLMELNLLPRENVSKTFSFFAKYFKTPSANFISSESLQKKSSAVEFSTAKKMKSYLIEMVNLINKNYNTSSYSD